ncbi:MAG TPA: NYN domain-containing protein [Chloroflexota bacterium]|nr:NYN domain-containing protein [Chloroflexota bacterium]
MRHVLVDGYNVIRADPRLQSIERTSLERARQTLVQTLASAPRLARDRVVVVFDGRDGFRTHVSAHHVGRVEVLYSARGQLADDVIIDQARELTGRGAVVVVTNDQDVRRQCAAVGCDVTGSENLLSQVPGRRARTGAPEIDDDDRVPTLSTTKRGNPRRTGKRAKNREFRF